MKRLKYFSIMMMILVNSLASSQGYTRISSQLKQKNDLPFPLVDSYDLLGGAASGTDRTLLPQERRKQGMLFMDTDDGNVYQLNGGIQNSNWEKFTGGGWWAGTDTSIFYNDKDVMVGKDFYNGDIRFPGDQESFNGLRIGNIDGTNAGSNVILSLNNEIGPGWDIFTPDLSDASGNVVIGIDNLNQSSVTGDNNIVLGKWTGYRLSSGNNNIYLGRSAGEKNSNGSDNLSCGYLAGLRGDGSLNIDLGQRAGYGYNLSSSKNINIGLSAGLIYETPGGQTSNISIGEYGGWKYQGDSTIMIGVNAGVEANGRINTMIGHQAGVHSDGENNLYLGRNTGMFHTGDSCVFIGNGVGYNYSGNDKVLIDVMQRQDNSYMIDLEGAEDKRLLKFNGKKFTIETNELSINDIEGKKSTFNISTDADSTVITSDNALKIKGTDLLTDSEIIIGGLRHKSRSIDLNDNIEFPILTNCHGWGQIQAGDDESFTQFRFSTKDVTLFNNTENAINHDMSDHLCIYYNGMDLTIKNRLGARKKVSVTVCYSKIDKK